MSQEFQDKYFKSRPTYFNFIKYFIWWIWLIILRNSKCSEKI